MKEEIEALQSKLYEIYVLAKDNRILVASLREELA
jgi:hypothetical protein